MTWSVRHRLALLASLVLLGTAAGCGDNTPGQNGQGGQSGSFEGGAGTGGNAGTDGGPDGDANQSDALDAKETGGDTHVDMSPETGETGGASGSDGGAGHDGGGGTGGVGTDGGAGTGGAGTGGAGTGGAGTGGAGTGGAGTGGAGGAAGAGTGVAGADGGAGTGGAGTGGAGTGGAGGAGTGGSDAAVDGNAGTDGGTDVVETPPPPACYSVTFTKPVDQAQLSAANDKDGDQCADGFQYDVVIATGAPNGTNVELFDGAMLLATVQATGGTVTFSGVQLSVGANNLSIQFPSTTACTDPTTKAKVTVDCSVPTCLVSRPIISPTHPELNGVSTTLGGDRASSDGSPYEVNFQVTTNIADNQTVALAIDNAASPSTISTVSAHASGGVANFVGVPLPGDGTYEAVARCTDGNGVVGTSAKGTYPVDTTPPDLTVSKPSPGTFIGPGGLTAGAFPVCGSTTASDAVNLSAMLGARAANYCVSTGGSPVCAAATTVGADTCISVPCPGDAPFSITVTISDTAGNPTQTVLSGITCSSSTPTVQIVTPVTDAPTFTDSTRHLLSANAPQPFRDQNGGIPGAQTDVTACTSRAGTAQLFAGLHGAALTQVPGATVATAPAGALAGCPAGLGFVAKFVGATLPESAEDPTTGVLTTATELQVTVTDVSSSTGSSTPLDLWVDSTSPVISLASPTNFCGSFHQAFATFDSDISFTTNTPDVTLTIVNGSTTDMLATPAFAAGTATFSNVVFDVGQNNMTVVASDAAGNTTAMQPVPCTVTVGMKPVVQFNTPQSTNELCASTGSAPNCIDDADPMMAGWQGSISVQVLVGGVGVQTGGVTFFVNGLQVGTEQPLDSMGNATLSNVTLIDGDVTLTAQTDNIPGNGVGSATEKVVVDLGAPNPVTDLAATVFDRRQTTMRLNWTAPSDFGGGPIAGYQVRYAKVPITSGNFDDNTVTTAVTYSGTPAPVGTPDQIDVPNLYIENGYYFAIEAVDAAGNRSTVDATGAAVTAHFNATILQAPGGSASAESFGYSVNGSGDVNGDGKADILVGTFNVNHAYLYLGSSTFPAGSPSVTFTGAAVSFGTGVMHIGDIDADGMDDLAISSPFANPPIVYIYKGRTTWPATLNDTDADYTITGSADYVNGNLGLTMARLKDFDGDGVDDFALGASAYNTRQGRVVIVRGSSTFSSFALPNTSRAITIDGDATLNRTQFGSALVALGPFYSSGASTLIVSAPGLGTTTSTSANEGRVYAFRGQSGSGGAISVASADNSIVGPAKAAKIGEVLVNLGPIVNGLPSVGIGNTSDTFTVPGQNGTVYIESGASDTGVFANRQVGVLGGQVISGQIVAGGGFSGLSISASLIGSGTPDLAVAAFQSPFIYVVDGDALASLGSPADLLANAPVRIPVPSGWASTSLSVGSLVRDVDGDGHPDLTIGEQATVGRVAVFW